MNKAQMRDADAFDIGYREGSEDKLLKTEFKTRAEVLTWLNDTYGGEFSINGWQEDQCYRGYQKGYDYQP